MDKRNVSPNKGKHLSERTKKKISESRIGKYVGVNNPRYGKPHSEETKKKMREMRLGIRLSDKQKKAISDGHKGLKLSEELKAKISANMSSKKKVKNIETNEIFDSLTQAAKSYNLDKSTLAKVCSGKRNMTGGYHWKYID